MKQVLRLLFLTVPLLAPLAVLHAAATPPPLNVFVLAGQSNMEGQGVADLEGKDQDAGGDSRGARKPQD